MYLWLQITQRKTTLQNLSLKKCVSAATFGTIVASNKEKQRKQNKQQTVKS